MRDKLAINADDSNVLKTAKSAMLKDFDDRYQDPDVELLMNKAAFLDPRFKKFPHLSTSYLLTTQLDIVSLSLKKEIEGLLQQQKEESSTQESDNTDTQNVGTSQADSEKPPQKKQKKIHPLRKLLGKDFGSLNAIRERSIEDEAQAELARYKVELQMPLEQNAL